jgi:hypothetical protein
MPSKPEVVLMTTDAITLAPRKRSWLRRFWLTVVSVAILFALFLFFIEAGGRTEFNPHTLQSRGRRETTIWRGSVIVHQTPYQSRPEEPLMSELVSRGLVQPVQDQNRWDPISHWNSSWKDGDGFWYDILTRRRIRLLEWSDANPELATLFWSEAFRYLRSDYECERQTGRDLLSMGHRVRDKTALDRLIRDCRVGNLLWARHSDPAERAYAEAEYQKLISQKRAQ